MCRRLGSGRAHGQMELPPSLLTAYRDDDGTSVTVTPATGIGYWSTGGRYQQHYYNLRVEFETHRTVKKIRLDCVWRSGNSVNYTVAGLYDANLLPPGCTFWSGTTGRKAYGSYTFTGGWPFGGYVEFEGSFPPGRYAICVMPTPDTWESHKAARTAANANPQERDFVVTATY